MKPIYQDKFGEQGNCLQAAIASLFELPLEDVPHFLDDPNKSSWIRMEKWCEKRDLRPVGYPVGIGQLHPHADYHLLFGISKRGLRHALVAFNGTPVHDPHPEGNGEMLSIDTFVVFIKLFNH